MIFRAADLAAGKVEPHKFPSAGDFLAVEQVSDVNGDGRTYACARAGEYRSVIP